MCSCYIIVVKGTFAHLCGICARMYSLQLHLSDKTEQDLPGLEDLGVDPTRLEDAAITVLRRYRNFYSYNKSLDDLESIQRP